MNKSIYVAALGAAVFSNHALSDQLVGCDFSDAAVFDALGGNFDNSRASTDDINPNDAVTVGDWNFSNIGGWAGLDANAQVGMPSDNVTKLNGDDTDSSAPPALDADTTNFWGANFTITIPAGDTLDLSSVTFDWRKATGGTNVRWLAFKTSLDSELLYSQDGVARNGVVPGNVDLTGPLYQGLTDTTVTFYWYAGGQGSGDVDFDTVIVNGTVTFLDDDGDGLPDFWELAQTDVDELTDLDGTIADPGGASGPGSGDFDGDGLAEIDEYNGGVESTDAGDDDTDDDGLLDGVEDKGGVYVNSGQTGTHPLFADTDNDGLLDGVEDNTGTFVSSSQTGTDPNNPDSDSDGLLDGVETGTETFVDATDTGTDPNVVDSDGDTMADGAEIDNGLDPNLGNADGETSGGAGDGPNGANGDPDEDGSINVDELSNGTDPLNPDTDDDGLLDSVEDNTGTYVDSDHTGTNPLVADTDGDGLLDGVEDNGHTFVSPSQTGTDPNNNDSDDDTLFDGEEVGYGLDPNLGDADGEDPVGAGNGPDGAYGDKDGDTIGNLDEIDGFTTITGSVFVTNPSNVDTDGDGFHDNVETGGGFDIPVGVFVDVTNTGTDPTNPDSDRDCLLDGYENNSGTFNGPTDTGTDPTILDTDTGGAGDGTEVLYGISDPTTGNAADDAATLALLPDILFIGGNATGPISGADGVVSYYMGCRYGTEAITYIGAGASTADDAIGRDVVVLSSTPGSGDIRNKFPNVATPMINWEEAVSDNGGGEFGMCDNMVKTGGATPTTLMDLAVHPITAGLPTQMTLFSEATNESTSTPDLFAGLTSVGTAVDGQITGGAGAIIGDPVAGNAMVFIAEAGDPVDPAAGVDGDLAPARRVMFPWTDNSASFASDDFMQLFGQSLDWATGAIDPADPNPYFDWAKTNIINIDPSVPASFDADADGDGIDNGLEWILGGDPLAQDANPLWTSSADETTGLTLTFTREEDSIGQATLEVEWDTDLDGVWTASLLIGESSYVGDNGEIVTVDTVPDPDEIEVVIPPINAVDGKLFARLKATQAQ